MGEPRVVLGEPIYIRLAERSALEEARCDRSSVEEFLSCSGRRIVAWGARRSGGYCPPLAEEQAAGASEAEKVATHIVANVIDKLEAGLDNNAIAIAAKEWLTGVGQPAASAGDQGYHV